MSSKSPDRSQAKGSILHQESTDPELSAALDSARTLEMQKERNAHALKLLQAEQGWLGRLIGGRTGAPASMAAIAVIFSMIGILACGIAAYLSEARGAFWMSWAEKMLAFGGAALGYLFGKSSGK